MNYKVIIDPAFGGSDAGVSANGLVEKDFSLLISNYIKKRLDDLGIENSTVRNVDRTISMEERVNIINSLFKNDKNVIVISNGLDSDATSGVEVIYALRNNDRLGFLISEEINSAGLTFDKYYQLRNPKDTKYDYYEIIRNTPDKQTVVIDYGSVNNASDVNNLKNNYEKYGEAVVRAIARYVNAVYIPLGETTYVVKKGDSLWKIAGIYNTSVDAIKKANNLTSNNLSIGQILVIPDSNIMNNTYIVKKGDSLWKIAGIYNTSVDAIKKANNLTSDVLSIGQVLVIPSGDAGVTYTVKKGDSLWKIAGIYNTSVAAIKKANNLTSDVLSIGQVLVIPEG